MKPWEETWAWNKHTQLVAATPNPDPDEDQFRVIIETDMGHYPPAEDERQLLSAAPEMARALLAVEWSGEAACESMGCTYPACPACAGFAPAVAEYDAFNKGPAAKANRARLGHRPDCALDAELRKAGVRA